MPYKKCNPKEELDKMCKEDIEFDNYVKEFNRTYEDSIKKKVKHKKRKHINHNK